MSLIHRQRGAAVGPYRSARVFLVLGATLLVAGVTINTVAGNASQYSKTTVWEIGGTSIVLMLAGLVLLLFAWSRYSRVRAARKQERLAAPARQAAEEQRLFASQLLTQLLTGDVPAGKRMWDVVLEPGEHVLLNGSVGYSRFYGAGPASFANASTRGHGDVGLARGLLDHATVDARNRGRATDAAWAAAPRWRQQQQQVRIVVTDRRLLCQPRSSGWLTFDHGAATAIKVVPQTGSVVLDYRGTAPMCLSGALSAPITVVVVWALYGSEGLREHPALSGIRPAVLPASAPVPPPSTAAPTEPTTATTAETAETGLPPAAGLEERLLAFVAYHELVLPEQAAAVLGVSVDEVTAALDALRVGGLVSRVRFGAGAAAGFVITADGAQRVDPALPALEQFDPRGWRRAVDLGWMSMAASAGSLGDAREVLTRRQMLAADASGRSATLLGSPGARFGDELPRPREPGVDLLYPDLALLLAAGGWVAVDLLRSTPDPNSLRDRLGRADRDPLIVGQVLVIEDDDDEVGELVESTAAGPGLGDRVQVRELAVPAAVAD